MTLDPDIDHGTPSPELRILAYALAAKLDETGLDAPDYTVAGSTAGLAAALRDGASPTPALPVSQVRLLSRVRVAQRRLGMEPMRLSAFD